MVSSKLVEAFTCGPKRAPIDSRNATSSPGLKFCGAVERHVLEEVRETALVGLFLQRTRVHRQPQRDALGRTPVVADEELEAVGQLPGPHGRIHRQRLDRAPVRPVRRLPQGQLAPGRAPPAPTSTPTRSPPPPPAHSFSTSASAISCSTASPHVARSEDAIRPNPVLSSSMLLRIKRLDPTIPLPTPATGGAAGFDLAAAEDVAIPPHQIRLVGTGLVIAVPDGHFLGIFARSSTPLKRGLMVANGVGVVDADYCGPARRDQSAGAEHHGRDGDRHPGRPHRPGHRAARAERPVGRGHRDGHADARRIRQHRSLARRAASDNAFVCGNADAQDPAHRHGRVLRVGGTARQPRVAGAARGRRRRSRRARRGRGRQLRGPEVRRPIGHPHVTGGPPLSRPDHRPPRLHEVPDRVAAGLRALPRRDAARRTALAGRSLPGRHREHVGRAARRQRGTTNQGADPRHHRSDRVGWCGAEQVPRQDCLRVEEARRPDGRRPRARQHVSSAISRWTRCGGWDRRPPPGSASTGSRHWRTSAPDPSTTSHEWWGASRSGSSSSHTAATTAPWSRTGRRSRPGRSAPTRRT